MNATFFVCTTFRAGKPVVEGQHRAFQLIIAEPGHAWAIHDAWADRGEAASHRLWATPTLGTGPAA